MDYTFVWVKMGASTYSLTSWMGIMWSNELCVHSINIFTCGWYRVMFFNSIPSKHLNFSISPATYYCAAINLNLNQLLLTQLQIPYYTELLYIMKFINICRVSYIIITIITTVHKKFRPSSILTLMNFIDFLSFPASIALV